MQHNVKLSNGETVILTEENDALSIALGDGHGDVECYVAQVNKDGVLGYSTASDGPAIMVGGLRNAELV